MQYKNQTLLIFRVYFTSVIHQCKNVTFPSVDHHKFVENQSRNVREKPQAIKYEYGLKVWWVLSHTIFILLSIFLHFIFYCIEKYLWGVDIFIFFNAYDQFPIYFFFFLYTHCLYGHVEFEYIHALILNNYSKKLVKNKTIFLNVKKQTLSPHIKSNVYIFRYPSLIRSTKYLAYTILRTRKFGSVQSIFYKSLELIKMHALNFYETSLTFMFSLRFERITLLRFVRIVRYLVKWSTDNMSSVRNGMWKLT